MVQFTTGTVPLVLSLADRTRVTPSTHWIEPVEVVVEDFQPNVPPSYSHIRLSSRLEKVLNNLYAIPLHLKKRLKINPTLHKCTSTLKNGSFL